MSRCPTSSTKNKIFTIPNILSFCRILLIPVIVWLYCFSKKYSLAAFALLLSGLTDIVDGFIARRFHMVSDLGKALDPVADKLTQGVTLICVETRFPAMLFLAVILAVKEIFTGAMSLWVVKKTKVVKSADWHGKVVTCLLYFTMVLHILWTDIPRPVTVGLTGLCLVMMAVSFVLYLRRNLRQLRAEKNGR